MKFDFISLLTGIPVGMALALGLVAFIHWLRGAAANCEKGRFEAWCGKMNWSVRTNPETGDYVNHAVYRAWLAWRERSLLDGEE